MKDSVKRALHGSAPCAEGEAAEHGETGYHRLLGDYACKQRYRRLPAAVS